MQNIQSYSVGDALAPKPEPLKQGSAEHESWIGALELGM